MLLAALGLLCCKQALLQLCCTGFSLRCPLLLQSISSRLYGLQQLRLQALGHRLRSRGACKRLVALRHVKSSQTRDRTHEPRTGRQIHNHWTTREVPVQFLPEITLPSSPKLRFVLLLVAQSCAYLEQVLLSETVNLAFQHNNFSLFQFQLDTNNEIVLK